MNIPKEIFHITAQAAVDAIILINEKGRVVFWNKASENMFGYSSSEILGKSVHEVIMPEEYVEEYRKGFETFQKTGKGKVVDKVLELEALRKSGERFPIEITVAPIKRKNKYWAVAIIRDITKKNTLIKTLSGLYYATERIGDPLTLTNRAYEVVKNVVEIFGCSYGWIGICEDNGSITVLAYYPENITYAKDIKVRWDDLPEGQGPTGKAVRSGKPEITTDITSDAEFIQWKNIASKYEFRSTAVFPLIARGKVLGALNLYSKKRAFFDMEKIKHMMTFARVAAIFLENIRLFEYTQKRLEEMTALRNIDIAISGSIDLRVVCNVALDEIINNLKVDAASVFIINLGGMSRIFYAGRGFRTKVIETSPQKGPMISRILRERKIIHIPDLRKTDKSTFGRQELIAEEEFVSYYGVPLIAKGNILGVLEIYYRSHFEGNKEWLNYLEILSGQIAISLDNAAIVEDLKNKHFELLKAYDETIEGWGNALSLKEEETEEHSQRVTDMTLRIAEKMGIKGEELVSIKRGALLHDIGKIGIPDVILLKPGKLTDEEWEIVKKHPDYAFMMLSPISYLSKAVEIPYCHHERWDGKGYPRGLKGKQIPLSARIFAVVDVWDALSYDRPYRKAWPKDKVIEYIKKVENNLIQRSYCAF